jgi:alpha-L-fucosidase 2
MRAFMALAIVTLLGLPLASTAQTAQSSNEILVSRHKAVFTQPPVNIPSSGAVDAPLMGNGDTLVAIGGAPDKLQFYVSKNDLWDLQRGSPRPLARIGLVFPQLQDASYRMEQNLRTAVTTGLFAKEGRTLAMETGVMATENLIWIKLSAIKGVMRGTAKLLHSEYTPPPLTGGSGRIQLGREQYEDGRWYLEGALDDVRIYGRALSASEVRTIAGSGAAVDGLVRRWDFEGKIDQGSAKGLTTFVDGPHGKALQLDGKTGYVDSDPWKPGRAVSVTAFVKVNPAGAIAYILSQGEWNRNWSLGLSGGKLRMAVGDVFEQSREPVPTGKWVHVAGVFDGREILIYVDGRNALGPKPAEQVVVDGATGTEVIARRFERYARIPTGAACALRNLSGSNSFSVVPGKPVVLVAAVDSVFADKDFRAAAVRRARSIDMVRLTELRAAHEAWWLRFWNASFVEIPDKILEQRYYLSQYVLASASRDPEFPPGLFGWVTTDDPCWGGSYTLNYNFVAPFYGLYAANHIEQADPCSHPFFRIGASWAKNPHRGAPEVSGIYQGRGIAPFSEYGPAGRATAPEGKSPEQKSNGAYCCVPLAMQWYATYDLDYAKQAYPYVKGVATFWENWLKFEHGQYNDYFDPVHEESGNDVNAIHSLALIRMVMNLALDMSQELGVDTERREKWTHIRDHLAPYPTCTVRDLPQRFWPKHLPPNDETLNLPIFRYTEKGTPWWEDNTLGIQHIFPAGGVGLDSPPRLLARARNQIRVLNRWIDFNGMNSFYAAAVRIGYDPRLILKEMRAMLDKLGLPNGMIRGNPHGMEHQSIVPNALQEMLLQSHEGVLRLFPCWPSNLDARFGTLRARGAFLVSAELKAGVVGRVAILSEKGRRCTVQNPWPGKTVRLIRGGQDAESMIGSRLTITTTPRETIQLRPE